MLFNYEPLLTKDDTETVVDYINSGIASPKYINLFEKALSNFIGKPVITCNSGTSALHLSLLTLGIGKGDEVICPAMSFAATWNVIKYVNANPVFVDIDKDTWNLDINEVKKKITDKTKAIISVDLYGNPCDYYRLQELCGNDIALISDSAQSFGSYYKGKVIGNYGDVSCLSFNVNKIITAGGGGAIVINNEEMFSEQKLRLLLNVNKKNNGYDYYGVGYNYRINPLNSALGYSQLNRIDKILETKNNILKYYKEFLGDCVEFQETTRDSVSNNWFVAIKLKSKKEKNKVYEQLIKNQMEVKENYTPAHRIDWVIADGFSTDCKNSDDLFDKSLLLPCGPSFSFEDIKLICDTIKGVL